MGVQYSTAVRIAMLDAIEVGAVGGNGGIGPNARLVFYAGAKPALCSDPAVGTVVATLALTGNSGDWMAAASASGNVVTKAKHGSSSWTAVAGNPGTVTYYRIYDSTVTTCHEQGTVTVSAGGGDITLDSIVVSTGQTITITNKTITAGNP